MGNIVPTWVAQTQLELYGEGSVTKENKEENGFWRTINHLSHIIQTSCEDRN